MIYKVKIGKCASAGSFIFQIPWQWKEGICASMWHMGYTRGAALKDRPGGQLTELPIGKIALQRGILAVWVGWVGFAGTYCTKEKMEHNARLVRRTDGADVKKETLD